MRRETWLSRPFQDKTAAAEDKSPRNRRSRDPVKRPLGSVRRSRGGCRKRGARNGHHHCASRTGWDAPRVIPFLSLRLRRRSSLSRTTPRGRRGGKCCDSAQGAPLRRATRTATTGEERRQTLIDPETGVVPGVTQDRKVRSSRRCSMCPAIHITSRSWLRSSSTHEPSDPPLRVISGFTSFSDWFFDSPFPIKGRGKNETQARTRAPNEMGGGGSSRTSPVPSLNLARSGLSPGLEGQSGASPPESGRRKVSREEQRATQAFLGRDVRTVDRSDPRDRLRYPPTQGMSGTTGVCARQCSPRPPDTTGAPLCRMGSTVREGERAPPRTNFLSLREIVSHR